MFSSFEVCWYYIISRCEIHLHFKSSSDLSFVRLLCVVLCKRIPKQSIKIKCHLETNVICHTYLYSIVERNVTVLKKWQNIDLPISKNKSPIYFRQLHLSWSKFSFYFLVYVINLLSISIPRIPLCYRVSWVSVFIYGPTHNRTKIAMLTRKLFYITMYVHTNLQSILFLP